jgi:superfamily II DNA or RNA helicase
MDLHLSIYNFLALNIYTMLKLRKYQIELIDEIKNKFKHNKKRVILCAPTGAGKTVIFTKIVSDTLNKDLFNRVLIITDRIELFNQTFSAIDNIGAKPSIYNAKVKKGKSVLGRCVVGMVETIKRRGKDDIGDFNLIIIDEAHKGNFSKIFEIWPDAFYIGATATPLATKKDTPLKKFYNDIAFVLDVNDLITEGFLMPAKTYAMTGLIDDDSLQYDYKTGDFTSASLSAEFSKPELYEGVKEAYLTHAKGKKTMIFCINIAETENIANLIDGAYFIHSKTSKEDRDDRLQKFHQSKDGVMVNCGILTTGYDHPPIEVIIMNRATMSLPLWLQCCGRGSRISPNTGKEYFTIIDMGGNVKRLGLWEDERDWIDWFLNPPKKGIGKPAPTRECASCNAMLPARQLECPYCGSVIQAKEAERINGVLKEAVSIPEHLKNRYIIDLSVKELHEIRLIKKYKMGFIVRVLRSKGIQALKEYEAIAGYKRGWHIHQISGDQNFKNIKIV